MLSDEARVAMTISCRDCDRVPKVAGAGKVTSFEGEPVQIMHDGIKVVAGGYHGDWMSRIISELGGHHEPQEELVFNTLVRHARPNSLMVELGSFWAYYSLWYLKEVPGSRAICVEPDPSNMEVGRKNAALNDFSDSVEFVEAWVGGSFAERYEALCETTRMSRALPLLDMQAILRLARRPIELLHIDAQGVELEFIRSMGRVDGAGWLRFLMVSTHHRLISGSATTHHDCIDEILKMGGTVISEHSVEESYAGDGLIVASFLDKDASIRLPSISRNRPELSLFGVD